MQSGATLHSPTIHVEENSSAALISLLFAQFEAGTSLAHQMLEVNNLARPIPYYLNRQVLSGCFL